MQNNVSLIFQIWLDSMLKKTQQVYFLQIRRGEMCEKK